VSNGKALSGVRFSEAAERFIAHVTLYGNPGPFIYQFRIFERHFGDRYLSDIGREAIEDFFRARRAAGTMASSCNRNRCALSVFFKWAIDRGLCTEDPITRIPKLREQPRQMARITIAELRALVLAAPPHLKAYLVALFWTGGRRAETIRLTWRWFDPRARSITFVAENTKSRRSRTVPVPEPLYRVLTALPRGGPDDRIFLYDGRPVGTMYRALQTACRRAGIRPLGFHALRRGYASLVTENGMPLQVLQELLGHASPVTTKKYIIPGETFLRNAAQYVHLPEIVDPAKDEGET
jgi:integrase